MCWTVFCFVASKSFQRQSALLFRQTILSIWELFLAQRTRPSHPHASTYEEDVSACIGIDRIQSRDMGTSRLRSMFHPQQRFTVWSISPSIPLSMWFSVPVAYPLIVSLTPHRSGLFWIQALQAGKDLQEAPFQDGWVAQLYFCSNL